MPQHVHQPAIVARRPAAAWFRRRNYVLCHTCGLRIGPYRYAADALDAYERLARASAPSWLPTSHVYLLPRQGDAGPHSGL